MCSKQRFALHREQRLVLQFHIHIGARVDNRLIQNRYCTHRVIHGVVHILYQSRTTSCHHHTSAWDVHSIQSNFVPCTSLVLTRQHKFILLRHLLCAYESRVVQLLEDIFLCNARVTNSIRQVTTKWFQYWENDSTS